MKTKSVLFLEMKRINNLLYNEIILYKLLCFYVLYTKKVNHNPKPEENGFVLEIV